MTETAGPTGHTKPNIEYDLTALCLVDDGMLKHIGDCTTAEAHRVKEDSSWDMTVDELKALSLVLVYICGGHLEKAWTWQTFGPSGAMRFSRRPCP